MAHVKRTTAPHDGASVEEAEDVNAEKALSGEGHGDSGSANGSGLVHVSEAGSQSDANAGFDEGPCSYSFGPSTMTNSRIQEMAAALH
jgi:hypothetical protein